MVSTSTSPGWAAESQQLLHRASVHRIALPVACDAASRFIPVQAVAEATGMLLELSPQLGKQHFEVAHIIRQFRTIEPGCVRHSSPGGNGMQLHMSSGVATALQPAGDSAYPQGETLSLIHI